MTSSQHPTTGSLAARAGKWSFLSQFIQKAITPLTSMVLARLLTPEEFGVVASATVVTSLADLLTDAGFQQYIIQHSFRNSGERDRSASVAFWTNLVLSFVFVVVITLFKEPLATACGSPGSGTLLAVASLVMPLTSMISVQTAVLQRDLNFQPMFGARLASGVANLLVAVGLAVVGAGAWSIVAGTLASSLTLSIWLTRASDWKPSFFFSFGLLRSMFSYGMWVVLESVASWANGWGAVFVVGRNMDVRSVGLYRTTTAMGNSITGLFSGSLAPVAFSSLARVHGDREVFERAFYKMLRYFALCIVPIAFGSFVFRDALVFILLGEQWKEVGTFLGLWLLAGSFVVVFGYLCSEAYRAMGVPRYSFLVQVLYLVPFIAVLWLSSSRGFRFVSIAVPVCRLLLVLINVAVAKWTLGVSPLRMAWETRWTYLQTFVALVPGFIAVNMTDSLLIEVLFIAISATLYLALVLAVKDTRRLIIDFAEKLGHKELRL